MKEVVIVSAARTPIGSFGGSLSEISATKLGAIAIEGALAKINLNASLVEEVYMGMVIQAGVGQAPSRQAARFAGLPDNIPCTTINKVCASGLKSVMLAAQSIMLGHNSVVVAGGMENMSQVPFLLDKARYGYKLGNNTLYDALLKDGLTDVYHNTHMGVSAELCAKEYNITREDQDAYAVESYTRAANAWKDGRYNDEIISVTIPSKKDVPTVVSEDEEYKQVKFEKIPGLKPVFQKDGTVTAANASTLNDGASALILMSAEKAKELGIKPLAKIVSFADAEQAPEWFTTSPSVALPIALKRAGKEISDIDFFEINEAFSVVSIANNKILGLNPTKVNVNGGAVALGHPLGSSGSRILVSLIHILNKNNGKYGAAAICNGGGGASSIVVEKL
jgi:acetyl-CoA C-acetyltransferase